MRIDTNKQRAERAANTLTFYRTHVGDADTESPAINVVDLLTDLHHFCKKFDVDMFWEFDVATEHFREELAEEREG